MSTLAERIETLRDEAWALTDAEQYADAEAKFRQALALFRGAAQPDVLVRALSSGLIRDLAHVLVERGTYGEARALMNDALSAAMNDAERLLALDALARLAAVQKHMAEAIAHRRAALELARRDADRMCGPAAVVIGLEQLAQHLPPADAAPLLDEAHLTRLELLEAFYANDGASPLQRVREGKPQLSDDDVRWSSHGTVREASDLRSWQIFGPERDYECQCGRYRGARHEGAVCEVCKVDVISSSARRRFCAHVVLPSAVLHPRWREVVTAVMGLSEDELLARGAHRWRRAYVEPTGTLLTEEVRALPNRQRDAMVIEVLPVFPPEARLSVDRERYERALLEVLLTRTAHEAQRAVDRLFAVFG
jgi:tetratricopeptide (TPR) repeat protein